MREILCEKRNLWGNELYEHWSTYVSVFLYPGKWAKFREKITYNREVWLNQCIFNDWKASRRVGIEVVVKWCLCGCCKTVQIWHIRIVFFISLHRRLSVMQSVWASGKNSCQNFVIDSKYSPDVSHSQGLPPPPPLHRWGILDFSRFRLSIKSWKGGLHPPSPPPGHRKFGF